jgi:hypothetical protein
MKQRHIERNVTPPEHIIRVVVHRPSVEHNIPFIPRGRVQPWEYPYAYMKVGDSFHVLETETSNQTVSSRVHAHNVRHPHTKFACRRQLNDKGEKLTRVWRIR